MRTLSLPGVLCQHYKCKLVKWIPVGILVCYFFYLVQYCWISVGKVVIVPSVRPYMGPIHHYSLAQNDTCDKVLSEPRLPHEDDPWFHLDGCTLHNYSESDAQTCLSRIASTKGINSILLVGDSRMRNFFIGLTKLLGKDHWDIAIPMRHTDFHFYNPSAFTLVQYRFRGQMNSLVLDDYQTWLSGPVVLRPRVIIHGHALWDLTFGGTFEESSSNFKKNLSKTIPYMERMKSTTDILWMLQDPTDTRKLDSVNIELRGPHRVDAYNNFTVDLLSKSSVNIWGSSVSMALHFPDDTDGIHFGPTVISYKVQLFMNWYCNSHMDLANGTCCTKPGL